MASEEEGRSDSTVDRRSHFDRGLEQRRLSMRRADDGHGADSVIPLGIDQYV